MSIKLSLLFFIILIGLTACTPIVYFQILNNTKSAVILTQEDRKPISLEPGMISKSFPYKKKGVQIIIENVKCDYDMYFPPRQFQKPKGLKYVVPLILDSSMNIFLRTELDSNSMPDAQPTNFPWLPQKEKKK